MHVKPRTAGLVLSLSLSILASSALASEIYRYTDEDGNVHFTDRPTGESNEERMAIVSRPTDSAAVQQRYDERFGQAEPAARDASTDDEEEDEEKPKTRSDYLAEKDARAQECERNRSRLEMLEASRRVYREDASGERTYLDDTQIEEAREQARTLVAETCD